MENKEIPRKLIAIDCVNGITYVGKDARTIPQQFVYDMFGWLVGKNERISDYALGDTKKILDRENKEDNYFLFIKKRYNQITTHKNNLKIPSRQIVAVHNLDDLDKE